MKKNSFSAIVFFIALSLFGETVMIETVDYAELGDLDEEKRNMIIQMETGAMDALFDGGHIIFSMYTPNGGLDSGEGQKSLEQARRTGAAWLVRLLARDEAVDWWIFSLGDYSLRGEGKVGTDDIPGSSEMTSEEFFFEAGKMSGMESLSYIER